MFGSKRSKRFQKFLSEKKSELADHPGAWLVGDKYDDLLVRHFEMLSPESQDEVFSSLLEKLNMVPAQKEQYDKTLKAVTIMFDGEENSNGAYPQWVSRRELPPETLSKISDIDNWLRAWRRAKRIEKIGAWLSKLRHMQQEINALFKGNMPCSRSLHDDFGRSFEMNRNLLFRLKALPADLYRKSLWQHFELSFDELNQNYTELIKEQSQWSNLYQSILKLLEDETDTKKLPLAAFSANRLQSFLDKPSQSVYSLSDLKAALDDVRKALKEYSEPAVANPPVDEDLFPGGELVWGDLLTAPMPQDQYARRNEMLVRSDILVERSYKRYKKVEEDLAENRADTLFVSMLRNPEKRLLDIKAWLKKAKRKPKGAKRFSQFLSGDLEAVLKLSKQYRDNEGLFGPAIDATYWWFGRNATLPPSLPWWVDDLLEAWLSDVPENLPRIFSRGWDRNVFALFTRISGTRSYLMEYLEKVWNTLEPNERMWLWRAFPNAFKEKWLRQWAAKWFENGLSLEEVDAGLSVYSISEKLILLDWCLLRDPLPEIKVLKTIRDQLGKKANNSFHLYLMQGFESDISLSKEATLVDLASEIFGSSLDLSGASSAFLHTILKFWKSDHENLKFGSQVIADASWKLAVRGETVPELDLLLYKDIPVKTAGSLKLNSSQWNLLKPVFDNPEKLDFDRIVMFMNWSDLSSIPLSVWKYYLMILKEKGEQHLKEISLRCRRLLESAKENEKEEISSLATLLYWAYCFFSNECSAEDVPNHVLKIEVPG